MRVVYLVMTINSLDYVLFRTVIHLLRISLTIYENKKTRKRIANVRDEKGF